MIFRDIGSNAGKSGGKLWHVKYLMLLDFPSNFKDLQNSFLHPAYPNHLSFNLLKLLSFYFFKLVFA